MRFFVRINGKANFPEGVVQLRFESQCEIKKKNKQKNNNKKKNKKNDNSDQPVRSHNHICAFVSASAYRTLGHLDTINE